MLLGILDEMRMRARILRERLRQSPEDVKETVLSLKRLEAEVAETLKLLSGMDAR